MTRTLRPCLFASENDVREQTPAPSKLLPAPSIWPNLDDRLRLCCTGLAESGIMPPMKYWEVIADKLSAAGWTWGYCSAVTRDGWRWIVNAHRGDGRRYIVYSDESCLAPCIGGDTAFICGGYLHQDIITACQYPLRCCWPCSDRSRPREPKPWRCLRSNQLPRD